MLLGLLKTLRPRQWFKNVFVLAPLVFAKEFFNAEVLLRGIAAFFVFSLLSGAVYVMNDIVDADEDREHETKRHRPIASGVVPPNAAWVFATVLATTTIAGAFALGIGVGASAAAYLANNLAYTFYIKKHVPYLDVVSIAFGFVLRVVAGSYAASTAAHAVRPSFYIIACTALIALFMGFGKRRHELKASGTGARRSLERYDPRMLTAALLVLGAATVPAYVLWTLDAYTVQFFGTHYLWLTTPFVVVGLLIFIRLVRDEQRHKSPTDEMIANVPFMLNLVLWGIAILTIIYQLRPTQPDSGSQHPAVTVSSAPDASR